jgi:hypothetical protein
MNSFLGKGGEKVSTGTVDVKVACRGSYPLVNQIGPLIVADNYDYALAA